MKRPYRSPTRMLTALVMTIALLGLMAFAIEGTSLELALMLIGITATLAVTIHWMFPGSGFFTLVFCNSISIYACLYTVFCIVNFAQANRWALEIGFALPLVTFLAGAAVRRDAIRQLVDSDDRALSPQMRASAVWLMPLGAIGISTFVVPFNHMPTAAQDGFLIGAMGLIAIIAGIASRNIVIFLIDTGKLFEDFFDMLARMSKPVFAFFTFYAITVIVYACLYRVADLASGGTNFLILGEPSELDFVNALYFSIVTLSTLGYGDIVPVSLAVKVLVTLEILCGVILLLFGFNALWQYASGRDDRFRR